MEGSLQFLLRYGYLVLFVSVFVEQIGLPLPAVPVLLAMGALAGSGRLSLAVGILVGLLAAMLSDFIWYWLGRRRGHSVLKFLCRISLEPDSCVRRTEDLFARHEVRTLLFAKFLPGLSTVAPPLAGMFRMSRPRFLFWDGAGTLLWVGAFSGAGFLFSRQLEGVANYALRLGSWLAVLLGGGLAVYLAAKYLERRRFLRDFSVARITPEELMQKLEAGEEIAVVDLRHSKEVEEVQAKLPGALQLTPLEIEHRHHEIPRDREVVVYCS